MEPFHILCTTCQARLKVTKPEAIGKILACPNCESMVLVTPPPGSLGADTAEATLAAADAGLANPWTSYVERVGQKTLLWAMAGAAGLVLVAGLIGVWLTRAGDHSQQSEPVTEAVASTPPKEISAESAIDAEPVPPTKTTEPSVTPSVDTATVEMVEVVKNEEAPIPAHEPPAERTVSAEIIPVEIIPVEKIVVAQPVSTGVIVVRHNRSTANVRTSADVTTQLKGKLRQIDFEAISLTDFVDFATELMQVPITLDLDGLEAAGVWPTATTSVKIHDATVAELFTAVLARHGLTYVVEDGHLVVTNKRSSRQGRERLPSESLHSRASDAIAKPVTFTFHQPTRLMRVADFLELSGGVTIVIDWRSLAEVDFTFDTEISCAAENRPLGEALSAVLSPLGLAWRAVDNQTLQITSQAAAERRR